MPRHDDMLIQNPDTLPQRSVAEWSLSSTTRYDQPFADVAVNASFISPTGAEHQIPSFHDGSDTWRVRFNPGEAGTWTFRITSIPHDPELSREGTFEVIRRDARGFLRSTPQDGWGFAFENGEPVFPFGDTVYNLFGMAHCGYDVSEFLRRRANQGFNLLRVRVPVSPFHPPEGYSDWQTRRTWPWGDSEQSPLFDRFNLDYFRTVDEVVQTAEGLGIGLEMIMEAWGFEFPFSSREIFTAEWEEHWMRYLIARYDAFNAVWFWTPLNEYEHYPNGDWNYHYTRVADRWQMRIARWIKATAPHGHIVSAHNGPPMPPFAKRFAADPEAVDTIMFQEWGTTDREHGWLAAGIEDSIDRSMDGWRGSTILSEWGYERNPVLELRLPNHEFCDPDHTRRGAWRAVFSGLGIIHGFENTWGPWCVLDEDQPGLFDLQHLHRFVLDVIRDAPVRPVRDEREKGDYQPGHRPLTLATEERDLVLTYLPAGGTVSMHDPETFTTIRWFDPRSGAFCEAAALTDDGRETFIPPSGGDPTRPTDWILVCDRRDPTSPPVQGSELDR